MCLLLKVLMYLKEINFKMLKDCVQLQLEGVVDDNAHGAVLVVFADVGDALAKRAVLQGRHGDEEMVFETREGENILLGATTWRVEGITRDRVVVAPAPGEPSLCSTKEAHT